MVKGSDEIIARMGGKIALVETAMRRGVSKQKIINELTRGMDHNQVVDCAADYADSLGLTSGQFVRMAGPRG